MRRVLASELLAQESSRGLFVGRVWLNRVGGPCVVLVDSDFVRDLSSVSPTLAGLMQIPNLIGKLQDRERFPLLGKLDDFLDAGGNQGFAGSLLAPCDLQPIKAAGVTFADSMLERVIEERAKGDPARAASLRSALQPIVGENLRGLQPGSRAAHDVKLILQKMDLWSQYLEVGIGADAEIFTKAQPMSAVGAGTYVGVHSMSNWNNPEPEVVLAVDSRGAIVGVTLGNDVNLRDVEGRSALLLGKAKDNNASCAIGPFVRLIDETFSIEDIGDLSITLTVSGADGYELAAKSLMSAISRSPGELVRHTLNPSHQYPDGFMLFLGTMFSPVEDRKEPGSGFTHEVGDEVRIGAPPLGTLINWVDRCDAIPPWTFGTLDLIRNLAERGLASRV
jgi:fumarylacetoacetate (FAA) hydrolase family protein